MEYAAVVSDSGEAGETGGDVDQTDRGSGSVQEVDVGEGREGAVELELESVGDADDRIVGVRTARLQSRVEQ